MFYLKGDIYFKFLVLMLQSGNQRSCVLRLQSDVPVGPVKVPSENRDLRGILRSAIEAKNLSPEEIQVKEASVQYCVFFT